MINSIRTIASLCFLMALTVSVTSGCASPSNTPDAVTPEPERSYDIEPWDGDAMEIPLDGSSMEAWERSMARVEAHSDPDSFTTLQSAIKYLLTYDLSARGDMNKLITNLDGLTGYQVLSRVKWRKPAPGKGLPEKDAKDASLIDT